MARVRAAPAVPVSPLFQLNQARYRDGLNQFVSKLNADGQLLLKEEMRLILREIMRFTPPKTYAQGRAAVAKDLAKNAAPLDPAKIRWPRMAEVVKKRKLRAIQAISDNQKQGFWASRKLLVSTTELAEQHKRNRTSRGRVNSDRRNMALLSVWRKYTRDVQSRVGFAKAGWGAAAAGVGFVMPSWVQKLAGAAAGSYSAPTPNRLVIEARNRSVKIPNYQNDVVYAVVRSRAMSIESELKRILGGGKTRRASLAHTIHGQPASK